MDVSEDRGWSGLMSRRAALARLASVAAGVSAVVLVACGSDEKSTAGNSTGPDGGSAPSGSSSETGPQATETPRRGGTLLIGFSDAGQQDVIDPAVAKNTLTAAVATAVYEPLITLDADFAPQPLSAESWTINDTQDEWTFTLRDAKFADGRALTAADVVFTYGRLLDESVGSVLYETLSPYMDASSIEAVDDKTVRMKLKAANAFLHETLADRHAGIVPADETEISGIGTGPFKVVSFKGGEGFELARNENYWDSDLPKVDGIRGRVLPDQATKIQSVLAGDSHLIDGVEYASLRTLDEDDAVQAVVVENSISYRIIVDPRTAPFDDQRVRMALKLAVDRQQIVDLVFQGYGIVANDIPIASDNPYAPPELVRERDVAKAKELLAEAGYPDGLSFELYTSDVFQGMVDLAVVFAEQVAEAGFNVNVQQAPSATYWDSFYMAKPAYLSYWSTRGPYGSLAFEFVGVGAGNEAYFSDPEFEQLLVEATKATTQAEQQSLLQQAYTILADESGVVMPGIGHFVWYAKRGVDGLAFDYTRRPDLRNVSVPT